MDMDALAEDLLYSAGDGNVEILRQFCSKVGLETFRIMCDSAKDDKRGMIHYAAKAGKAQMCKYLIETVKLNIKAKTGEGDTPLLVASNAGQFPAATYLLEHGADAHETNIKGKTALHLAACHGNTKFIKLLIAKGADIEANSIVGTPLQCAVVYVKKEAVIVLLDHGANPNSTSTLSATPLLLSIGNRSFDCIDLLVKAGADINTLSLGMTPLAQAASKSEIEIVKYLLKAGANPNVVGMTGMTPLEYAALERNNEVVMLLLSVTSPIPTVPDWSRSGIMTYFHSREAKEERERKKNEYLVSLGQELLIAAVVGNIELLKQYCADVGAETFRRICDSSKDTEGLSAIHHAAMRGKTEICKYLIETVKVNVKAKAGDGDTPLIVATRADQIPTATYLLNHGADANESNIKGVTALHAASSYGHTKFMKLLIAKGAQIEANSDLGTSLVSAVGAVKKEAVMLLSDRGANPNSTPSSPINPLMLSIAIRSFDCVNLLVKAGADTNALMFGKGPLSLAVSKSEIEIVKFLLKAGANPNLVGTVRFKCCLNS